MIPADPIVCVCARVSEDTVLAAIHAGARTISDIRTSCGANTGCGGCADDIGELLEESI
ncbi:(2Fe-2S)-binding protein [Actinokineospora sp.]|uniref:(2Fe-2S)-binding protein n=1 Tax=Actinokineospora sp. TaxID=1872133 RepID=UPI004037869C